MPVSSTMRVSAACEVLEWDSAFFGRRIARYRRPRCLAADVDALLIECAAMSVDCAYVLVDVADTDSSAALQRAGAYFADVRVTFGTSLEGAAPSVRGAARRADDGRGRRSGEGKACAVRLATENDVAALTRIASSSHRDTRFYADPHFDVSRCDRLYEVWIENSCGGFADAVFVAPIAAGEAAGYVTCHIDEPRRGHIGLFAVAPGQQGQGYGTTLLDAAIDWFSARGVGDVTIATQLRNVRALQFYAGAGMIIRSVGLWFHLWPADRAAVANDGRNSTCTDRG
jgi:dTDP-4-amino-4,6-dideoxy-D-galactose acyltransferase